jgi:hypothetical protein
MLSMAQLSTSAHQVAQGAWNLLPRPATSLAIAERTAESSGFKSLAVHALACWAVAVTYPLVHLEFPHPLFDDSVRLLGPNPPWDSAIALCKRPLWRSRWANKLQGDAADRLQDILNTAAARHNPQSQPPVRRGSV